MALTEKTLETSRELGAATRWHLKEKLALGRLVLWGELRLRKRQREVLELEFEKREGGELTWHLSPRRTE